MENCVKLVVVALYYWPSLVLGVVYLQLQCTTCIVLYIILSVER